MNTYDPASCVLEKQIPPAHIIFAHSILDRVEYVIRNGKPLDMSYPQGPIFMLGDNKDTAELVQCFDLSVVHDKHFPETEYKGFSCTRLPRDEKIEMQGVDIVEDHLYAEGIRTKMDAFQSSDVSATDNAQNFLLSYQPKAPAEPCVITQKDLPSVNVCSDVGAAYVSETSTRMEGLVTLAQKRYAK